MFICRVSLNNKKLISSVNRALILLIQFYLKRLSGDLLATKQRMKIVLFHFGRSVVVGKYHFNLHIMIMCGFFSFSFYTYVRVIFFCFSLLTPEGKIWSISDLTRTIFWLYKHIVICCRGSETGWYHQNTHTF